ncbi:MAG: LPS export ABC transporter periplasmic protein LptC [Sulfuricaulis sp.]
MTVDTKRLAIAATLLLLALGSWWLTRAVGVPEKIFNGKGRHDPDFTVENFKATVMNDQGQRLYSLSGPLLVHYGDDGSSDLTQPYLIQYPQGRAPVYTRADKGWMPKGGDQILMSENVTSAQGRDPRSAGGEIRTDSMNILLDR